MQSRQMYIFLILRKRSIFAVITFDYKPYENYGLSNGHPVHSYGSFRKKFQRWILKKITPSYSALPNASFQRWIYFSLFSSLNYLRANLIKPPGKSLVFEADSWSPIVFFLSIRPIRKQATQTLIQSGIISEGISSNQISQRDNLCSAARQKRKRK